jgi:hypothetical protein
MIDDSPDILRPKPLYRKSKNIDRLGWLKVRRDVIRFRHLFDFQFNTISVVGIEHVYIEVSDYHMP